MMLIFLSSGLFLGWSLGANDAANVFGTAVGTKMIRFKTAAIICSVFVIAGAVIGGAGAAHTLQKLGSVNAIAGSFIVALSAGLAVFFWISRWKMPVSTSQGIVGAIIGWNFFTGSLTDYSSLAKIVMTWVLCPVLSAVIAVILYNMTKAILNHFQIHLLQMDMWTRIGLVLVGAFGSYSLGANNIANVMGVFVPVVQFPDVSVFNFFTLSGVQQLFGLGGIAIAVGVFTYSKRVMDTVGSSLFKLSAVSALVVVLAHSIVLFLFSSESLEYFLATNGLPTIPLVPVSSSQAIVGAVVGIGLLKGGRLIKFRVLGRIALGWIVTPLLAGLVAFISLFIFQNVFDQTVYHKIPYRLTPEVMGHLEKMGIADEGLFFLTEQTFENPTNFKSALKRHTALTSAQVNKVITLSFYETFKVDQQKIDLKLDEQWFTSGQIHALKQLDGNVYHYRWQLEHDLLSNSPDWHYRENTKLNKSFNRILAQKYERVCAICKIRDIDQ